VQTENSAKSAEKCKNRAGIIFLIHRNINSKKDRLARLHDFFPYFLISHFLKERI
jgi:hypothetical protein